MREKLIQYVNSLFPNTVSSAKVRELHDEILQNTLDRYDDEIAKGLDEQTAYQRAVAGIGDIETILEACNPPMPHSRTYKAGAIALYVFSVIPTAVGDAFGDLGTAIGVCLMFAMIAAATALLLLSGKAITRNRLLRAVGIALYIFCVAPPVLFDELVNGRLGDALGVSFFFLIAAAATFLVVFSTDKNAKPSPAGSADPVPAEAPAPTRSLAWRIGTPLYWILAVVGFSFLCTFGYWRFAWMIFPFAGALGDVITGCVLLARHGVGGVKLAKGLLWVAVLVCYWLLTVKTQMWAVTWIVFPIGAALSGIVSGIATLMKGDLK